jgi:hypothetical protein
MTTPPRPAWRHHYLPQFYLRGWAAEPDGLIWRYKREPSGELSAKRVSPKATGYEQDLYSIKDTGPYLPDRASDVIETSFLRDVDNGAAVVLPALARSGPDALSESDKMAWALFLNSLLERDPRTLKKRELVVPGIVDQLANQLITRCDSDEGRERWKAVLGETDLLAFGGNTLRRQMVSEIRDGRVLDYFVSQSWRVVKVEGDVGFVTADAPLVVNGGGDTSPIQTLALALNPKALFFMHAPEWQLDDELIGMLVLLHNLALIEGDARYLYSQRRIEDGEVLRLRRAVETCFGRPGSGPFAAFRRQ